MRVAEVANCWGISQRSVYRLVREGILKATKVELPKVIYSYDVDAALVLKVQQAVFDQRGYALTTGAVKITPVVVIRGVLKRLNSSDTNINKGG